MVFKIIKKIYLIFIWPVNLLRNLLNKYVNYAFPNIHPILRQKIKLSKGWPRCYQKTLITGSGIIEIGEQCVFGTKSGGFHRGGSIEFQTRTKEARIRIGNKINTNNNIFICSSNYIEIGENTLIGQYVTIMDFEAHGIAPDKRREVGDIGKVIIGRNVWLGNNVTILKNSEIGDNTIVATGAVVSGKFPNNVIIGGVPAKIIKEI